jgi:hypothetical protein
MDAWGYFAVVAIIGLLFLLAGAALTLRKLRSDFAAKEQEIVSRQQALCRNYVATLPGMVQLQGVGD